METKTMTKEELIHLASKYAEKGYDYETMYYCDDFHGKEEEAEACYEYIIEYREIGSKAFREKYKDYKLY